MPKKILVTGGAGFIGSNLVESLLSRGDEVIAIDNFDSFYDPAVKRKNIASAKSNPAYRMLECDIRDLAMMESLLADVDIDVIFHGAARAGVRPSIMQPFLYEEVNIKGTMNMLELARGKGVKNFVFAASSSVYGNNEKVPFSEDDNVDRPISPYAATKKACEEICYTFHHLYDIPVICLRFFTVYGPRQRPEMAIHKFTRLISSGSEVPVFGDGSSQRDYTYIDDCISGVVSAIDAELAFEIINLGESEITSLNDLILGIETAVGKTAKRKYLPEEPGDVRITFADISKARKILGYDPRTPVRDGIRKFVKWYNSDELAKTHE